MPDLPTGTVTFLFTDVESSTTRWKHHRAAMQQALARHDAILRTAIEVLGRHIFKTVGDAFYAVFISAVRATCVIHSCNSPLSRHSQAHARVRLPGHRVG